jgi:hypothetical protein
LNSQKEEKDLENLKKNTIIKERRIQKEQLG